MESGQDELVACRLSHFLVFQNLGQRDGGGGVGLHLRKGPDALGVIIKNTVHSRFRGANILVVSTLVGMIARGVLLVRPGTKIGVAPIQSLTLNHVPVVELCHLSNHEGGPLDTLLRHFSLLVL